MKKFIVGIFLFLFALNVQGQWNKRKYDVNHLNELNETQLMVALQHSRNKIKTGQIMTGIGVGCELIGGVLLVNNFCIFSCTRKENFLAVTGSMLFIGGFYTMAFGILKWIVNASRKNKIELALANFNTSSFSGNIESSAYGLSMKIHFW